MDQRESEVQVQIWSISSYRLNYELSAGKTILQIILMINLLNQKSFKVEPYGYNWP